MGLRRVLSVTVQRCCRHGPGQSCCAATVQGRGMLEAGGRRFPVLPTVLGVNASVKRWITDQHIQQQQ